MMNGREYWFLIVLLLQGTFTFCSDEHPRYTAARLTDHLKNIIEGHVDFDEAQIFTDDVHVHDCDGEGHLEYLKTKLAHLIAEVSQVSMTVKFAYHMPYTNNSIQFTVDQFLVLKNADKSENELVLFAKADDENSEIYKIYELRQTPCT